MEWNSRLKQSLKRAQSAETQAIAIYRAESWCLARTCRTHDLNLIHEILLEEQAHASELMKHYQTSRLGIKNLIQLVIDFWNVVAGSVVGMALCLLSRKCRCRVHVWAEHEAARIYLRSCLELRRARQGDLRELTRVLFLAARQEREHARRFNVVVNTIR